ncbi:hypothetical protein N431DRAFT_434556 [Stipitochalara longipes BDJ]|nr:hypothetical protein N431DRAFT_434556 [Stipitochalara longipes BDJ]
MALSLVYLAFYVYFAAAYSNVVPVAFIAVAWCLTTDLWEFIALLSSTRSTARFPPRILIIMDTFAFLLLGPCTAANMFLRPGGVEMVPADDYDQYDPAPDSGSPGEDRWENIIVWYLIIVSMYRFFVMILSCIERCSSERRRR